tara:strand:- start:392 stop:1009 length:618 start_codon:yes stop_codon:yes gene_type:complete|mmetsp:Transcript_26868/g.63545  ORF Transcript_26868/g.63545 Transcript_26868/m.63545 type:complete len:206 (-) Transcript_26868:180-797(-)
MTQQLFAGNLAWTVTSESLTAHMLQAGYVVSADVQMRPDGKSKGWALVTFPDNANSMFSNGMDGAVEQLNETDLDGRKLLLRRAEERGGKGKGGGGKGKGKGGGGKGGGGKGGGSSPASHELCSNNVLFVGNLSWSTNSETLTELFASYGVLSAEVKMGPNGRSRGYGLVEFETIDGAAAALACNDTETDGRPMLVRYERVAAAY